MRRLTALVFATAALASLATGAGAQTPAPAPASTPTESPTYLPSASPLPSAAPATPPPIVVSPEGGDVAVGSTQLLTIGSVLGTITATVRDPSVVEATVDQSARTLTLTGKAPGTTVVTIADSRGLTRDVPVRVAFYAGQIRPSVTAFITGDPSSQDFVRSQVVGAIKRETGVRPGGEAVVGTDDVPFDGRLDQDRVAEFDVPVLIQGENLFSVNGTTHVRVENIAVPRISPTSMLVSDFPERLTENGELFTSDLLPEQPSRFLYFHYNPPGQPDRRIVLHAQNLSAGPAVVQFIAGVGGPYPNEMQAGHESAQHFLEHLVQNEGRLITIPPNSSSIVAQQDLPPGQVVCALLQLRVLSGGNVRLTLAAEDPQSDPNDGPAANAQLLQGSAPHARGRYDVPEFHFAAVWNVTGDYLDLPIGQLPLPNQLKGEALGGDYGVLQAFVVTVQNPTNSPQPVALYENPRGGWATGTYLIDGVVVQSHRVPPFSRYKIRQYVVPARGFVRTTIVTMPEGGSSYPLRLTFAPDDGSVAPGAPGSPVY